MASASCRPGRDVKRQGEGRERGPFRPDLHSRPTAAADLLLAGRGQSRDRTGARAHQRPTCANKAFSDGASRASMAVSEPTSRPTASFPKSASGTAISRISFTRRMARWLRSATVSAARRPSLGTISMSPRCKALPARGVGRFWGQQREVENALQVSTGRSQILSILSLTCGDGGLKTRLLDLERERETLAANLRAPATTDKSGRTSSGGTAACDEAANEAAEVVAAKRQTTTIL